MTSPPHPELDLLEIRTGCRLHFGLMELCAGQDYRFAGLGLMLESPGWRLSFKSEAAQATRLSRVDRFNARDTDCPQQPVHQVVETLASFPRDQAAIQPEEDDEIQRRMRDVLAKQSTNCPQIAVRAALPLHGGLGAGTQLACAVALGAEFVRQGWGRSNDTTNQGEFSTWYSVDKLFPDMNATSLARLSGRGLRSAIGLVGFLSGGLILDHGYRDGSNQTRTVTATSHALPEHWRVVLIQPPRSATVAGQQESRLLEAMAAKPNPFSQRMFSLAVQATQHCRDLHAWSLCVGEYMRYAAEMFAPLQGGHYNGPQVAQAVAVASSFGLTAVGQSSWGPAVFGFCDDPQRADRIVADIRTAHPEWIATVTRPATTGAQVFTC